jgi:Zn finger protein HypA/HybF involved in hydrogenase expression
VLTHILAVPVVLAVAIVVVIASPTRKCPRCNGRRVTAHRWNSRIIGCPRCRSAGRAYRRGAALAHSLLWQLRNAITTREEPR